MTNMNDVKLIGRIVKDTVLEKTPNTNVSMARFTIAVNRDYKKNGELVKNVTYVDLAIFETWADKVYQYLKQGTLVAVTGHLSQKRYEKDGAKMSKLIVVCDELELLSKPFVSSDKATESAEPEMDEVNYPTSEEQNYSDEVVDLF